MPKLIRLIGDSTQNDKEIRNIFSDSIFIEPNSTIAVRNVSADLVSTNDSETFQVDPGTGYTYRLVSASSQTVVLPPGTYNSPNALVNALSIAANSSGTQDNSTLGLHNEWNDVGGKARLELYKATTSDAEFDAEFAWDDDTGLTYPDARSVSSDGSGIVNEGALIYFLPLVHNRLRFTIGASGPQTMTFGAVPYDAPDEKYWAVRYAAGAYYLVVNEVATSTGYAGAPNDEITLSKYGSTVRLVIVNGATTHVDTTGTLTSDYLAYQRMYWHLSLENTAVTNITDCDLQYIEAINPLILTATIQVNAVIDFGETSQAQILRKYLGMTDSSYVIKGDPAVLEGKHPISGVLGNAGTLITIDGLDLESYTGTVNTTGGQSNILDVIPVGDNDTKLAYQPSYPLKLGMKNSRQIVLRHLTVRFQRNTDANVDPLRFIGKPVVVLEID